MAVEYTMFQVGAGYVTLGSSSVVEEPPPPASGWTTFAANADTVKIYCSSSTGSDSNDGLSTGAPVATLAHAYSLLRTGHPDWLLLKRGDTWTNESFTAWGKSGLSATYPMIIRSYPEDDSGSTARPLIKTGRASGIDSWIGGASTRDYIAFMGLDFYAHLRDPADPGYDAGNLGTPVGIDRYKDGTYMLVEDCRFRYYSTCVNLQTGGAAGMSNMQFRRCQFLYSYMPGTEHSQGVFATRCDGLLIEECFFDHNGWNETTAGTAWAQNHNLYTHENDNTNVILRGNISCRASATGLQCRPGGLVDDNLLVDNPTNLSMGHAQVTWPTLKPTGRLTGNVILGSRALSGGASGRGINCERVAVVDISDNIIANLSGTTSSGAAIRVDIENEDVTVSANIVYDWTGASAESALSCNGSQTTRFVCTGNQFQQVNGGKVVSQASATFTQFAYSSNSYYTTDSSSAWFAINGVAKSYAQWNTASGETGDTSTQVTYSNPGRDIESYMTSIGATATRAAFYSACAAQSRLAWSANYTAANVIAYIRAGYGL